MIPSVVDQDVRERVRRDHATSFVLVAGAGTGKTTLLVDRIELLVRSGRARLTEIAAVTFTENAAASLKLRLRERLERARGDAGAAAEERLRAADALDVLERAAISTIHALCAGLLRERPIECGVLPGVEVADEVEADQIFAEAWDEWLTEQLLRGDATLLAALDRDIPLDNTGSRAEGSSLRGLARRIIDQRDLAPRVADGAVDDLCWRDELLAATAPIGPLTAGVQGDDLLARRLRELAAFAERARFLSGETLSAHLERLAVVPRSLGQKRLWLDDDTLRSARAIASWTRETVERWRLARGTALHARLVSALTGVARLYERKKNALGRLDFLDLLVKTRDALRGRESLRREFQSRFRYLIIDEFQDTDPLQCEIAEMLTRNRPGALVVVGDAKQSIYRFRRAEVARLDRMARETEGLPDAAALHLTQNFRSRPAILRFVNQVFARLIEYSQEAEQPAYEPVAAYDGLTDGPAVLALRFSAGTSSEGEELLRSEAAGLARALAAAAGGHWMVRDPLSGQERASRAGDVMVLARRLTKIRFLEEALDSQGLRFVVEGGKTFFDRQEVREALCVLRAIDDPSNGVALVAALRSTFFGVSDRGIAAYALAGGRLSIDQFDAALAGAEALGPACGLLAHLNAERRSSSVPMLIERLYDETRVLAALTGTRRGEAQIANLEKVLALARAAERSGVHTLRAFVRLLAQRIADGSEEPDLPATRPGDPDTVRILTIHKAKGLEAPIVALHDTADDGFSSVDIVALRDSGQVAIGFRAGCQPPGWAELVEIEKRRIWAEGRRLLYVACTRARDWLVVPRPPQDARMGAFWRDLIQALPPHPDRDVTFVDTDSLAVPTSDDVRDDDEAQGSTDCDAQDRLWQRERDERIRAAAYRAFVPQAVARAAAEVAPASPAHSTTPDAQAFGALVHRLLEWIPLAGAASGATLAMAQALAASLGLDAQRAESAAALVERALTHPLFERARRARVFREMPVWLPEDGRLLEGRVDLVFEEAAGLVVVDYKTEPVVEAQVLDQAAHHGPQLQMYGRALTLATGVPVRERLVFFTHINRAVRV